MWITVAFVYSFGQNLIFIRDYSFLIHMDKKCPTIRFFVSFFELFAAFLTIRHFFVFYVNKNIKNLSP